MSRTRVRPVFSGARPVPRALIPALADGRQLVLPACCPGTASPTKSPTGAPSRSIRIIIFSACRRCTRSRRACVLRVRRWRSGWTASWCASTTGASLSRLTFTSPWAGDPSIPTITPPCSLLTPPGRRTTSSARRPGWVQRWPNSPSAYSTTRCPGPRSGRDTRLLRLGERYTAQRLDAACQRALAVDLIDVRRLERILVQALEEETTPQLPLPMPPGRFARPGSVFAQSDQYRRQSA